MDDLYVKIGIAVASLVTGHLVARWWDRARPLLVLSQFVAGTKLSDSATATTEIQKLTKESMSMRRISKGEVEYRELEHAYEIAEREIRITNGIEGWIAEAKRLLTTATTDDDVIAGIRAMLRWTGLRELVELLYYRNQVKITPSALCPPAPKLTIVPSSEHKGCLHVVLGDVKARLGGNFDNDAWRRKAVTPLIKALENLDRDYLIHLLDELPAHAAAQRDIHHQLIKLIQPIRDDNTYWIAHCTFVNFGNSPFVIWPHARLILREKGKRDCIDVPCCVAIPKPNDHDDAVDLKGPTVVESGKTLQLWIITNEKKAKLQNGNTINALFKDKSATGQVRLLLMQRGIPFKYSTRSTPLNFSEA